MLKQMTWQLEEAAPALSPSIQAIIDLLDDARSGSYPAEKKLDQFFQHLTVILSPFDQDMIIAAAKFVRSLD